MEIGAGQISESGPKVFERETRDVNRDSIRTARDVGQVRLNHSRLNIFSTVVAGETEDFFKFQVASKGPLRLGMNVNDDIRLQILDSFGRVKADSDPSAGRLHDKYQELISDEGVTWNKGHYYMKVSTVDGKPPEEDSHYTLQLRMGDVSEIKRDYDTIEYVAKKPDPLNPEVDDLTAGAMPSSRTLMGQGANSLLDAGATNLANILNGVSNLLFGPGR